MSGAVWTTSAHPHGMIVGMRRLTAAEAADRAELLTVTSYDVDLDLTRGEEIFGSRSTVRFRSARPGAATFAELRASTVHEATLNGRPVDVADGRIALTDLAEENVLTVVADCAYSRTAEGLHRFVDPVDGAVYTYSMTFLYEGQQVFACFDQPDLKAPWRLSVTAPPEWTVLSNAVATQVAPGRWEAAETPPLATYFMALAAGPYHSEHRRHGDHDLGLHCRQSLAPYLDVEELFGVTASCMDFFEDLFGMAYPFGPSYDQVFVPEFNAGAMENPGLVTFRDEFLFRSRVTDDRRAERAEVVAHEMAHMWFGDLVSMRWWDDLWLNESFADHMGRLAVSRTTRWTNVWAGFVVGWEARGYKQDQLPSTHPVSAVVPDTDAALLNFDGISYAKGAAVRGQLVAWVGEDVFFDGVREYFRAHAFGSTRLADLLGALERASGRELAEWSRAWLQTAGVNTLTPEVNVGADGSYEAVTIRQDASPLRRPHRVAIGLYGADGTRYERIELDVAGERTPVPELVGLPAAAVLLLNDDDLTYAKIRFDAASLATLLSGGFRPSEPVARALCWSALWDMTRDAELPAEVFADAVLAGIGGEPEVAIVQRLLAHTREAVDQFLPDAVRPAVLTRLAEGCRRLLAGAEAGGEAQIAFAYAYAGWLTSDAEVAEVRRWLDGDGVPPGLAVDQELRWSILRRLAVLGHASGAELAAEEQRDGTSKGRLAAATARAALPTAEAKRAAWDLALADGASAHLVEATVAGFWQPEQLAVLRPYGARYFDLLPRLWRDHGPQVSITLAEGLYPLPLVDPDTAERSAERLADDGLHPAARRILAEQADQLARARLARATAGG